MANNGNKKETKSPFMFNPLTGKVENVDEVDVKTLKKTKTIPLPPKDLAELGKKMNCPAVLVMGFPTEINRNSMLGEVQMNSMGIQEEMTVPLLGFVSHIIENGYGRMSVEHFDVQVLGGTKIPPNVKQKIIEELKKKLRSGEITIDKHGNPVGKDIEKTKSDIADAIMGVDPAKKGGDSTIVGVAKDGKLIQMSKHPQRTPLWKRVITFFKRPKLSESNLEKRTLPVDPQADMLRAGTKSEHTKTVCPICEKEMENVTQLKRHITMKARWEKKRGDKKTPYTKLAVDMIFRKNLT